MNYEITLRDLSTTSGSTGFPTQANTDKTVWADIQSVRNKEYWESSAAGAVMEKVFVVNEDEYSNQMYVVYDSTTYKVVRTYLKSGRVELHCMRK